MRSRDSQLGAELCAFIDRHELPWSVVSELIPIVKLCAPSNEWISVEDRLPEENQDVLIADEDEHHVGWLSGALWYTPSWVFEEGEITHWMPLPEPPKK